jgi:pyruvate/2-oxoglutarate dehydrogenase complex dihydrolipoamide dehydrogenase (E3) component
VTTAELEVDLLVVGWGKAGKTLARRYASAGRSVALVERDPAMYGGTCINVACVPTKDLVVAAEARRPEDDPQEYFRQAVAGRDELVHDLNTANHRMLEGLATLVDGEARFTGPREVDVRTSAGEPLTIRAQTVVIGTGTVPARPDLPGLDLPGVYDSTTIQHADPFPRRLAVVGGGFVGLEFASMFQQFGSQVTLLDPRPDILPRLEPAVVDTVRELLASRGVTLRTSTRVREIERAGDGLRVLLDEGSVEVDAVLVATGRTPVTAGLDLDRAGVGIDARGYIPVDERLRTSADGVYAVGDVNGGPQFTYISLDDNRVVWDQLVGEGRRTTADRVAVPNTTFITPPLSQVGLTPAEALERGHDVLYAAKKVAAIAAMPRPKILGDADGIVTFTVDAASRQLLGATLFCVDSQEIINLVALAMRAGVTADTLLNGIWTHPSSTEALNEVLAELKPYTG